MTTTISGTAGVTFPAGGVGNPAGTVVGTSDSQTLTSKTLTSPTMTTPTIDSAQVATVSGTAPLYMARAWVNFNGTGTVAIRSSGNVTSITDNGVGDYTVNLTTAMPDANYSAQGQASVPTTGTGSGRGSLASCRDFATSSFRQISTDASNGGLTDAAIMCVAVFR